MGVKRTQRHEALEMQQRALDFVGSHRLKPKPKVTSKSAHEKAREQAHRRMQSGEWEGATARELVALYEMLHEHVYGVSPEELGPRQRALAGLAAGRMLKEQFESDPAEAAAFLHWTWQREAKREKWRRENRRDGGRIGWRLQFGGGLITDYRLELARKA